MADTVPLDPTRDEWIVLRSKVWDAQKLARTILGRDATELTATDMLQAIRTFAAMKEELQQLQRESRLTQQALVATQCSQTYISKRLDRMAADDGDSVNDDGSETSITRILQDDDDTHILSRQALDMDSAYVAHPDSSFDEDVPHPEANLEEEIMRIVPTKSKSLGVGLLGDMEQCIIEWQTTFEQLNDKHEFQVQACQADLERLHVRLDTMKALHPTGVEAATAAKKARDQLVKLVKIVEAFPSKARMEALQQEIEALKQAERASHEKLARAMQDLETIRMREKTLLCRLEAAESSRAQLEATLAALPDVPDPKNKRVPTRLMKFAKKKLQRIFRLDRSARTQLQQPVEDNSGSVAADNIGNSTSPSTNGGDHIDSNSNSGLTTSAGPAEQSEIDGCAMHLRNVGSHDDELLLFCASDHDSSDDETEQNQEDWSAAETLDATNRQEVLLAHRGNFSPGKLSPTSSSDEADFDLSHATDSDDTILSEALSFITDATTNSTSGTPPKKMSARTLNDVGPVASKKEEKKSFFAKAKSMLWLQ